jgi:hypothetical protein
MPEMTRTRCDGTSAVGPVPDPAAAHRTGAPHAIVWGVQTADGLVTVFWGVLIVVGALTLLRTVFLCAYAIRHARQRGGPAGPGVSR